MRHAAVPFDALKFVATLQASGFDEPQAKGMAAAIREDAAGQSERIGNEA
ncbi:hypothetical protein [Candidatus Magnetaquiglobus chichijimensis]